MSKRVLFLFFLVISGFLVKAQCLTNSLVINTGYNPITGTAIAGSANGGIAVPDPHWVLTAVSPDVATAIAGTPVFGLVEVVPGNNADIISTLTGSWVANPAGNPGGWISCLNSNTYNQPSSPTASLTMTLGRPFRLCSADDIVISINVASDNSIVSANIDGTIPLTLTGTGFAAYTFFTQTVNLSSGTHTLNIVVVNANSTAGSANPTGLNVYGTVSSATSINSLVSESYASCATYSCGSTCNTITLADSLHLCEQTSDSLLATVVGPDSILSIAWTPTTGLSNPAALHTGIAVTNISQYYYLTVKALTPYNLVSNGDFSAGNTGFTSTYTYSPPPSTTLNEGFYSIYTNPNGVHSGFTSFGDHTTGTGNMMIINGGSTASSVWCETIPVTPNTDYDFSAWFANCSAASTGSSVPVLQFMVNGVLLGTPQTVSSAPATWVNFFSTWNSGTNTTANICIYDEVTVAGGNDFVIDDISFQQICTAKDSIYVDVHLIDTTREHQDTAVCASVPAVTLTAPAGYSPYLWNTGSTAPFITVNAAGTYYVTGTATCARIIDTFHVVFNPLPVVNLGNDTGFCSGDSILLSSPQPVGNTYLWSNGSTSPSIYASASGTYWLQVNNGCLNTDSIKITVDPLPAVNLGNDTTLCSGQPLVLQSSVAYAGSPTYLWNTGATTPAITVTSSGKYWLQVSNGGCPGADTINVLILYDTVTLHTHDTAICKGQQVQVLTTGSPLSTYQWIPTTGIAAPTTGSPVILGDTSAEYILTAHFPGCPDIIDSFYLDVQPSPVSVYIGGNRNVCAFDTLHIHATVTPAWYTGYHYSWTPVASLDNSTLPDVTFYAGDSTEIVVHVTTSAGCNAADSAMINVFPGNFAHVDSIFSICPHDSVQLMPFGGVSYNWSPSIYLDDAHSATPWVHAITTQDYTLIATSQYGCRDTLSVLVTVRPAAVIYLPDSVTLYPGDFYQLNPQTNCTDFLWRPSIGLNTPYVSNPVATPDANTKYYVFGTTTYGCKTEDSISIFVDPQTTLQLPNAFTPGSGPNGLFKILKLGLANLNYFRIYNRWGNVVYESTNIDEGWDGTYKGKAQPFDVYVYEVEAVTSTGVLFHKQGNVTLIR